MMTDTINYDEAVAALEADLDRAADEMHDIIVREGFDEEQISVAMQRCYLTLDQARARAMATIDAIFSKVETRH